MKALIFNWHVQTAKAPGYTYLDLLMVATSVTLWGVMVYEVLIGTGWAT